MSGRLMDIQLNNGCALLSIYTSIVCVHFGVKRSPTVVYKKKGGREVGVECDWIWGRATEQYDHCLEYFGLGPLLLLVWVP